jgi:hypothetical protein
MRRAITFTERSPGITELAQTTRGGKIYSRFLIRSGYHGHSSEQTTGIHGVGCYGGGHWQGGCIISYM